MDNTAVLLSDLTFTQFPSKRGTAMKLIFILLLLSGAGLIIWRYRVLEDSNYQHRRRYYEHLVSSEKHRAEEDSRIRKEEGL